MVELLILACLAAAPERCDSFRVPFYSQVSQIHCMLQGQLYMKQWADEHPLWTVKGWRCQVPEA